MIEQRRIEFAEPASIRVKCLTFAVFSAAIALAMFCKPEKAMQ